MSALITLCIVSFLGGIIYIVISKSALLQKVQWKYCYYIFTFSLIADAMSTFHFVRIIGWEHECNFIIQFLGSYIGYGNVLFLLTIVSIVFIYIFGKRLDILFKPYFQSMLISIAVVKFICTINNIFIVFI